MMTHENEICKGTIGMEMMAAGMGRDGGGWRDRTVIEYY